MTHSGSWCVKSWTSSARKIYDTEEPEAGVMISFMHRLYFKLRQAFNHNN